jgi:TolB-like protein/class 3 adenylate cyclase/cytochrome c-type biogenesis protein CcmH/NrfG
MSAELPPDLQLEIAHLLLIDVVGYSKLLVNDQVESLQQLNRIVRSTDCFQAAEAKDKLIRLPTGDGMALLFFENLEQPARCALEIAQALQSHPKIQVRMGIHSGPINQVPDVNDRINIAGAGINVAQRVLDCGDAGHILLSKHVADDLGEYRHWQPYLRDLGECEVKHGLRLHLVNLCKAGLGNPQVPEKLRRRKRWKETVPVHPVASPRWPRWAPIAALLLSGCALAISFTIFLRHRAIRSETFGDLVATVPDKSIAVLPFENLSDDKQNAYFADGVQDEILTNLAKVADLKVISRTSVMQYKNSIQRNLREVGKALGVAHILEGTVQRAGGRVRVSAQLIDARTDAHLWAERYDREIADVFAIENELAEQIVAQLKSKLSSREKAAIERKPTADLAAYDLYTRAKILIERAVFNEPRETSLLEAVGLLEQASSRDPSFALAYYQLAHAHDQLYWVQYDRTPQRLALADAAIQTLRRLQPDSGEAHLAVAKHLYWGYLDYDRARQELAAAERALPNDSECLLLLGYIDRRQGRWDESINEMQRAQALDPRNIIILKQIALSFRQLRRYSDVITALDRALELDPNDIVARSYRARVDLEQRGDTKSVHSNAMNFVTKDPGNPQKLINDLVDLALFERDPAMAARALSALGSGYTYSVESVGFPRSWCEGRFALLRGDTPAAKTAFTAARKELEKAVREQPDNAQALIALGMVDAALGQKKDAIREGRRAIELFPVSKDAIDGSLFMEYLAAIYATSGKADAAIDQLAATAKIPGHLNYGELRLDPIWDPLHGDPRFDKIVASLAPK